MALTEGRPLAELDSNEIRDLQNLLLRAGFNPGPIDGQLGPLTEDAYTRFLRANGYVPEGSGPLRDMTVIRAVDQMSKNTPGIWEAISRGSETGAAVQATQPQPGVAPPTPAPSSAPAAQAPAVPAGDGATEGAVRTKFPHLAYLLDNPEVKDVLLRATQGGWDQATLQGELWKTQWWQTTSNTTRLWDQKFAQDNATAMQEWDQSTVVVGNIASQMGFALPANDTKWIAGRVKREGWSDDQLKRFLGTLARQNGIGPGQVTEKAAGFKATAKRYMSTMSDQQALEYAIRVSEGSLTQEGVESLMRNEAKSRFTWLGSQIDAGLSPMDLFGGTRNTVAQVLEMDPNQIDLQDPRWSELTSAMTGEDGKPRSMNFSEAQRWARQRPEWRFTDNANKESAQTELFLLKSMGLMA